MDSQDFGGEFPELVFTRHELIRKRQGQAVSSANLSVWSIRQAGDATCSAGKWRHVGETPGEWGFDEWTTGPAAGGWYTQRSYTQTGKLGEGAQV
jgi:hypothetical protein